MSYRNFVPTVWSASIEREREKNLTALTICNRQYEGEIKRAGDKVKILGIGRPTIFDYNEDTGLSTPEVLDDVSTMLEITEKKAFNFMVGDIDQRQAKGDLISAERDEAAAGMAEVLDSFIYGMYKEAGKTITAASVTTANIFSTLAGALTTLYDNRVPKNETIYAEVSPQFAMKLVLAKIIRDTDNSGILQNGIIGNIKPLNLEVRMSNNIHTVGGEEKIFIRTKKAIAAAVQLTEVEAYRPEKYFADAIKGIQVYGAKVVRPKELVVISAKYGAETSI